ncbi:MAG: hypothetical protein E6Q76_07385 [Rhizobium sp.]|nr:MAG: hypothetical protein E6Q76_07385 [Rhizobium sp.]
MIVNEETVQRFTEAVAAAQHMSALVDAAEIVIKPLGFEMVVLGARIAVAGSIPLQINCNNSSDEWNRYYDEHEFLEHDPLIKRSIQSERPFGLDELDLSHPKALELRTAAWSFGICHGFAAPVRGAGHAFGTMIVTRGADFPIPDPGPERRALLSEGREYATVLLERMYALADEEYQAEISRFGDLSQRELTVLKLMRDGLVNKQIADRLHVSFATVRLAIASIVSKLGVKKIDAALLKAIASERIRVVEYPRTMRDGRVYKGGTPSRVIVRNAGEAVPSSHEQFAEAKGRKE